MFFRGQKISSYKNTHSVTKLKTFDKIDKIDKINTFELNFEFNTICTEF